MLLCVNLWSPTLSILLMILIALYVQLVDILNLHLSLCGIEPQVQRPIAYLINNQPYIKYPKNYEFCRNLNGNI
jgi:hypothetical protein